MAHVVLVNAYSSRGAAPVLDAVSLCVCMAGNAVNALLLLRVLEAGFANTVTPFGDATLSLLVGCGVAVIASAVPWPDRATVHATCRLKSFSTWWARGLGRGPDDKLCILSLPCFRGVVNHLCGAALQASRMRVALSPLSPCHVLLQLRTQPPAPRVC